MTESLVRHRRQPASGGGSKGEKGGEEDTTHSKSPMPVSSKLCIPAVAAAAAPLVYDDAEALRIAKKLDAAMLTPLSPSGHPLFEKVGSYNETTSTVYMEYSMLNREVSWNQVASRLNKGLDELGSTDPINRNGLQNGCIRIRSANQQVTIEVLKEQLPSLKGTWLRECCRGSMALAVIKVISTVSKMVPGLICSMCR